MSGRKLLDPTTYEAEEDRGTRNEYTRRKQRKLEEKEPNHETANNGGARDIKKGVHKKGKHTRELYAARGGYLELTIVCHKESYIH